MDHPVVYTDRITDDTIRSPSRRSGAFVVGVNGSTLTHAEDEATTVASLLQTSALPPHDATAVRVLKEASTAAIVHIVSHGVLMTDNPYESSLVVANDEPIEAWQLFRGLPGVELVTLSACDTRRDPRRLQMRWLRDHLRDERGVRQRPLRAAG
jgi:CHAT domain-containing protein